MLQIKIKIQGAVHRSRNTHSIEIDRYDIDDIDALRTFHSISRSRSVAAISNNTDPDGKTKILTKLWVKLPHRNIADIMEVKVDDGAEVNILPLHTFRSMFPHKLDENSYPKINSLRGSKMTLQCYDDSKLVNHGTITLQTEALRKRFISGPPVLRCWDTNSERDHHRTLSKCQVRSHPGTVWKSCENRV